MDPVWDWQNTQANTSSQHSTNPWASKSNVHTDVPCLHWMRSNIILSEQGEENIMEYYQGVYRSSRCITTKVFTEVVDAFEALGRVPLSDRNFKTKCRWIKRFGVLMYDRASSCSSIDDARLELFTQKGLSIEFIPPTSAALYNMQREQYIRQPMSADNLCWKLQCHQIRLIGDGQRTIQPHGSPCGQRCPKLTKHVKNLSNVVARATEVVVVGANV